MAANDPQTEADCTCPVCCDLFNDPVLLLCGHSFCKYCLQEWWRQSTAKICPVCKDIFPLTQPPRNIALKNLSDSLRQERNKKSPEEFCRLHGEKIKLFCQDDQQPVCVICRDSKAHKEHNCVPINEAADEFRANLQVYLLTLKSKKGSYEKEKQKWDKMSTHIQVQTQQTLKKISAEFQNLYHFLRVEEAARIDACRKESTLKTRAMRQRIQNLTAEISELTKNIQTIEKEIRAEDISFIRNVKTTMKRSLCKLPEPETPKGALIDEAKHIGNLKFSVWKKMAALVQYTPVILDPNTGDSLLTVSENLTGSTKSGRRQPFPDNPERQKNSYILGHQGFNSGKHSWDVEVGGYWALGVAAKTENLYRSTWAIYMCLCTSILRELTPEDYVKEVAKHSFPQKVRVQLDYDQGMLSFFDLSRNNTVHTIKYKFTETVFPYFCENVKVLPVKVSVSTNMQP